MRVRPRESAKGFAGTNESDGELAETDRRAEWNEWNDIFQSYDGGSGRSLLVVGFLHPLGIGGAFPAGRSSISSLIDTTFIYYPHSLPIPVDSHRNGPP